jgi:hypothetical protein
MISPWNTPTWIERGWQPAEAAGVAITNAFHKLRPEGVQSSEIPSGEVQGRRREKRKGFAKLRLV